MATIGFSHQFTKISAKLTHSPAAMWLLPSFYNVLGLPCSCPHHNSVYTKGIRFDHRRVP